jgi:hypothetical protein
MQVLEAVQQENIKRSESIHKKKPSRKVWSEKHPKEV